MASSPRSAPSRPGAAAKDGAAGLLSPRFRSAAALAGWDEESLLASLVVEDTPVRESRRKRRPSTTASSSAGGSAGSRSGTRKRRLRRQSPVKIPPVVLALDDDDAAKPDTVADGKSEMKDVKEDVKVVDVGEKEASGSGEKAVATGNLPCMDRLREELSCAICLEICFEPSTTPCGHSFCMKCLKNAAAKCGKRCPKCRQLISNSRTCTINTVLWNTIQLLFPAEVEARRNSISSPSSSKEDVNCSPQRSSSFSQGGGGGMRTRSSSSSFITEGRTRSSYRATSSNTNGTTRSSNSRRGFVMASQLVNTRSTVRSDQSEDAVLAYRLQQEEFMNAFEEPEQERQPQNTVSTARDNLRAMASRAIRLRARGWPV